MDATAKIITIIVVYFTASGYVQISEIVDPATISIAVKSTLDSIAVNTAIDQDQDSICKDAATLRIVKC